jgi:glycosyltransferase involved in cell wall biosynthesis
MRVLMQIRQNVFALKGGDTTQMVKTKEALEARGVDVELSLDVRSDVSGYDVVHLFNLTRVQETFVQARNARAAGKPVVLSTIYWPTEEFERNAAVGLRGFLGRHLSIDAMERLKAAGKYVLRGERGEGARHLITHSYRQMQREILDACDVFLPNAEAEMDQIETHLGFSSENYVVVPNAVDTESIRAAQADGSSKYEKYKGWLVCIGRIDIRKNQMNLIRALDGSDYKIVFVGKKSPGHREYADEVVRAIQANPNMEWIEQIPNEDVYKLCRACKVSVLPSWFETPGLVSLEAAAMGCNIVVSPEGTTRDYFGGSAYYCDVSDPASIREAIDEAYAAPYDEAFGKKVLRTYTWERAAEKTLEGYEMAMGMKQ